MAAAYLVELPNRTGYTLPGDTRRVVVYADSETQAKEMAKALYDGGPDAPWGDATVTAIAVAANLIGYTFDIKVFTPAGVLLYHVEQPCTAAASDTVDEVAALLVTALEALGGDDLTPSYNSGTQVLTIATGSGGDDIGNHRVVVTVYRTADVSKVNVPGFVVGSITHLGDADAPLSLTFAADTYRPPALYAALRSQ